MMSKLAYPLIAAGFLGGSFVAVLKPLEVDWAWFALPMALGLAGVWLLRHGRARAAGASHRLSADFDTLRTSLERIVANLKTLEEGKQALPPYQARFEIDRLFRRDLSAFAEARESMIQRYGLRQYAAVMSAFAAGERYLNRVWSASTDGYVDEVREYLTRAQRQFREAKAVFDALATDTP